VKDMAYNSDRPVKSIENDKLNRKEFIEIFAESIMGYDNQKDCLVIGLIGEWGSGKSSIINMAIKHIKEIETVKNRKNKLNIICFNPWIFSNQKNLVIEFFKELENKLNNNDISKAIKRYSLAFTQDMVETVGVSLKNTFNEFRKDLLLDGVNAPDSVNDIKNKLSELLSELNSKILIIIDDIDRLLDEEIKLIFQLVKSIADFPNIIYLLSFDKKIVIDSLRNLSNPEIFIEKIIQIPVYIPKISTVNFNKIIQSELSNISGMNSEFHTYLFIFFKNIRDLKRYSNVLNFYLPLAKEKLNLFMPDFTLLLAIQLFDHELFSEITDNKSFFVETNFDFTISSDEKSKIKDKINEIISLKTKIKSEDKKKNFNGVIS
jgi:predicted KAP-like P-loop ATPase